MSVVKIFGLIYDEKCESGKKNSNKNFHLTFVMTIIKIHYGMRLLCSVCSKYEREKKKKLSISEGLS